MTDYTDAQLKLIEKHRDFNVHDTWYDFTIDQFVEECNKLKFDVSVEDVQFSGFWSQGDGASFTFTSYGLNAVLDGCVEFLKEHVDPPADTGGYLSALWSFATNFLATFEKYRLLGEDFMDNVMYDCHIQAERTGYHYSHSRTVTTQFTDNVAADYEDIATESGFYESCREFGIDGFIEDIADALYHDLEAEHEYQTSDDAVWEALEANGIEVEEEDDEEELCEAA